jgi:hypothetical protein
MMNQLLYDRFYFSSYPASGDFDFEVDHLINNRYQPFRPKTEIAFDDEEKFRGSGTDDVQDSLLAAENLMVRGAFNVNSTSVNAWKAVLSSLRGVEIGSEADVNNLTAPFTRTLFPVGGSSFAQDATNTNGWEGFVNLTDDQIDAIAEEMSLQVMKRGPFMSMADFVNRLLISADDDTYDLGLSGALQAALDKVVNQRNSNTAPFDNQSILDFDDGISGRLADDEYRMPSILSGSPGYLLQGDVLSALEPTLSARSDTFTIRTYGDASSSITGESVAQVWCEAVVQRYPDYVDPSASAPSDEPTGSINTSFGRRYKLISFRWLSADEI